MLPLVDSISCYQTIVKVENFDSDAAVSRWTLFEFFVVSDQCWHNVSSMSKMVILIADATVRSLSFENAQKLPHHPSHGTV